MEYQMMIPPFEHMEFEYLSKKEVQIYFEWYINQIGNRIKILENYIISEGMNIHFDYSPESLIPIWNWYEGKIRIIEKTTEELEKELRKYPNWMHSQISKTKISLDTLKYGMDIAIYFAEIIVRRSKGKIKWGYFSSPKSRMSVNEPTLLGFKGNMDLNPRLIVINCTRRSSIELKKTRLFDMYNTWVTYVD